MTQSSIVYRLPRKNGYGRTIGYYEYTPLERVQFYRKAIRKAIEENRKGCANMEYIRGLVRDYREVYHDFIKGE